MRFEVGSVPVVILSGETHMRDKCYQYKLNLLAQPHTRNTNHPSPQRITANAACSRRVQRCRGRMQELSTAAPIPRGLSWAPRGSPRPISPSALMLADIWSLLCIALQCDLMDFTGGMKHCLLSKAFSKSCKYLFVCCCFGTIILLMKKTNTLLSGGFSDEE